MKLSTRLIIAMMLVALATAAVQALLIRRSLESVVVPSELARIGTHASLVAADLRATVQGASEDVSAVEGMPAVSELVSAISERDADPSSVTDETIETRRLRVQTLLHSVLAAKPHYAQFRLIGTADGGREVVRVNRSSDDGTVQDVPVDALQQKGSRDYFVSAFVSPRGTVLQSPINLNREHGEIEVPHHPVLRTATPVRTSNDQPYGALVVNVDMAPAFQRVREANDQNRSVFVVDQLGNYLVHPDRDREFGADLETPYRLQADYPNLSVELIASDPNAVQRADDWTEDRAGERYYAAVRPVVLSDKNTIYVVEAAPRAAITAPVVVAGRSSLIAAFCAALCAAVLAVVASRKLTKGLVQMTSAVDEFGDEGPIDVPTTAAGEIGILARAFDRMTKKVNVTTSSLKQEVAERRRAEEGLRDLNESLERRVADRTAELQMTLMELTVAKDSAEDANRAKSLFLANMSHEVRTPMAAVMGASELLMRTQLSNKQVEYTGIIRESCAALLAVINDILDFSKIEAGQLRLEQTEFVHDDLLGGALKALGVRAQDKDLELTYRVSPGVPTVLTGDPMRLRQVIVNLVGNALKFTKSGDVWLEVFLEPDQGEAALQGEPDEAEEDSVLLHYKVSDTGVGIPADKAQAIFEAFEQADVSTTRRYGGTGLGLAITSALVEIMGGRVWFESEEGRGATFHFTSRFIVPTRQHERIERCHHEGLQGVSVLVVDDNQKSRTRLDEMLTSWGMAPDCVPSADEAVSKLREAVTSNETHQVLLIDAQMPGCDGVGLVGRVRDDLGLTDVPVVMLGSAEGQDALTQRMERELAGVLVKPIGERELFESVRDALGIDSGAGDPPADRGSERSNGPPRKPTEDESLTSRALLNRAAADEEAINVPAAEPDREGAAKLRILLAEDSKANRLLILDMLSKHGYEVDVAKNGQEAVDLWLTHGPDLILMDVQMPEVDGIEATRTIREFEEGHGEHTPIIAITAHAMKGDRDRCLEAGMDGYISKPFQQHDLIQALRGSGGKFSDMELPAASKVEKPRRRRPAAIVDWSIALESADGDAELLKRLAEISVRETDDLLEHLFAAVERGDADALLQCAQNLKNHYRIFDAAVADHVAFHIENTARDGSVEVGAEVDRLRHETHRLQGELIDFIYGRVEMPQKDAEERE